MGILISDSFKKLHKVFYIWPKTKTIENLFYFLDVFSALIPISIFLIYWKKSYPVFGLRILFFYAIAISVINLLQYLDEKNSFLYELFTVVEAIAFIGFLYLQIKNTRVKRALFIVGSVFILFNILYPYFVKEVKSLDSIPIGIETIIILVFSFYYLYEKTNDTTTLYIYSTFSFWIVIGMVLYLAGSFFIYLFASSISNIQLKQFWAVTNFLAFLKNVLFAIGIITNSKPPKKMPVTELELSSLN